MTFKSASGIEFVEIPAGSFIMGSDYEEKASPPHKVTISQPFYMSKCPITRLEWTTVMEDNPANIKQSTRPAENISWYDAGKFIKKLNIMEKGDFYRLPTEAEWEYACRAGSTTRFFFGDDVADLPRFAWFDENSGKMTHEVGELDPNPWGLHDMVGNIWEWCSDWFTKYPEEDVTDPKGAEFGTVKAFRGGSGNRQSKYCVSAFRNFIEPKFRGGALGLRLVRKL
jgi:formylglycine-generating enzyme required for sulfatase activity